jgi:hypothetical protein
MVDPARLVPTPRLDDLIGAIKQANSDDSLAQLSDAVLVSEHLGELADQQRFVPKVPGAAGVGASPDGADPAGASPFARFTPRTRNAIVAAHNSAREAGHGEVEPAHLLLGLLSEPEAIAARVLVAGGATIEALTAAARAALPPDATEGADPPPPELVPYSDGSKAVLERTLAEALRLGHNYVGTEHILLALVAIEGYEGSGPLTALGVTADGVEEAVQAALAR